ncbi:hypothetical protein L204_101911 [Cryptococcus depauperatus]|nr:hypothetical protein L204_05561 [Cryptococcus depauperatus CBS 7855]
MDSRSSQHGKRSERLSRNPYSRPVPATPKTTPKGSSTFGVIKSALSLFSSPFNRLSPKTAQKENYKDDQNVQDDQELEFGNQNTSILSDSHEEKQSKVFKPEENIIVEPLAIRVRQSEETLRNERRGGWLPSPTSGEVFKGSLSKSSSSTFSNSTTPFKQRYLGPGVSPRKTSKLSSPVSNHLQSSTLTSAMDGPDASSLPPSFPNRHLVNTLLRYSATSSPLRQSHRPATLAKNSQPVGPSSTSGSRRDIESAEDSRPSKRHEIEATGRQNAAVIMQSLLDETDDTVPKTHVEPVRFNAYDRASLYAKAGLFQSNPNQAGPSTPVKNAPASAPIPSSARSKSTPKRNTPLRGAAAKLEAHRQSMIGKKPLTTIERIKGIKPWETAQSTTIAASHTSRSQKSPTPQEDDESESSTSDAEITEKPSSKSKAIDPEQPVKMPEGTRFDPYQVPSFVFAETTQQFKQPASSKLAESFDSPTRQRIIDAPKKAEESAKANKFSFTTVAANARPLFELDLPRPVAQSIDITNKSTKVLTSKDAALRIDKLALPFFTFIPPAITPIPLNSTKEKTEKAQKEATLKSSLPAFTFVLEYVDGTEPKEQKKKEEGASWMCTMCMLQNPDSAKDKCTICEEPRPQPKNGVSAPAFKPTLAPTQINSFAVGGPGSTTKKPAENSRSKWTCSLCMLENPASAEEKCTICEHSRSS